MIGVNVFAADTDGEAYKLFTSLQQAFLNLIRGMPGQLPAPVESMEGRLSPLESAHLARMTKFTAIGSLKSVRERLAQIVEETGADELIATAQIYDHDARLRSFEILAQVGADLG